MERKYENVNRNSRSPGLVRMASETFMANLPILVCGLIVGLVLVKEFLSF